MSLERRSFSAAGITLTECLMVVVIVAVLIGLAVPGLARSRNTARLAGVHAVCRGMFQAVTEYADDWQGALVYAGTPMLPWQGAHYPGQIDRIEYFSQDQYFQNLLVPGYWQDRRALEYPGGYGDRWRDEKVFASAYWMTGTAFASPRYFEGERPPLDLTLFRRAFLHETAFPSSKGLLIHKLSGLWGQTRGLGAPMTLNVACADGSAGARPAQKALDEVVERPFGSPSLPVIATRNGLAGVDF